ncbi:hypothetical protein E2C01_079004 [Portunus trituberculatus]|uniref:Uncharacterized protein n=1 Tax=Portunus trituberculatus TaxID=210409 RepID=A0A5B7IKB8_PORTR|nr:hypothetical protein [Portunus trituberculatus]
MKDRDVRRRLQKNSSYKVKRSSGKTCPAAPQCVMMPALHASSVVVLLCCFAVVFIVIQQVCRTLRADGAPGSLEISMFREALHKMICREIPLTIPGIPLLSLSSWLRGSDIISTLLHKGKWR